MDFVATGQVPLCTPDAGRDIETTACLSGPALAAGLFAGKFHFILFFRAIYQKVYGTPDATGARMIKETMSYDLLWVLTNTDPPEIPTNSRLGMVGWPRTGCNSLVYVGELQWTGTP